MVALFPCPLVSPATVPLPSFNRYSASRLARCGMLIGVGAPAGDFALGVLLHGHSLQKFELLRRESFEALLDVVHKDDDIVEALDGVAGDSAAKHLPADERGDTSELERHVSVAAQQRLGVFAIEGQFGKNGFWRCGCDGGLSGFRLCGLRLGGGGPD